MEVTLLEEVKEFCKIDGDEEDVTLNSLIEAAKLFILSKTNYRFGFFKDIMEQPIENQQAILALKMLVMHWYENREPTGQAELITYSLNALIIHLSIEYGGFKYENI